jgi:hypothetical protein
VEETKYSEITLEQKQEWYRQDYCQAARTNGNPGKCNKPTFKTIEGGEGRCYDHHPEGAGPKPYRMGQAESFNRWIKGR